MKKISIEQLELEVSKIIENKEEVEKMVNLIGEFHQETGYIERSEKIQILNKNLKRKKEQGTLIGEEKVMISIISNLTGLTKTLIREHITSSEKLSKLNNNTAQKIKDLLTKSQSNLSFIKVILEIKDISKISLALSLVESGQIKLNRDNGRILKKVISMFEIIEKVPEKDRARVKGEFFYSGIYMDTAPNKIVDFYEIFFKIEDALK